MNTMRQMPFRLPLGIYRNDSLIGALLCFGFDPSTPWNRHRILVVPEASWEIDAKRWWTWGEVAGHFRRLLRQQQGVLENRAIRHYLQIRKASPAALPSPISEVVRLWRAQAPDDFRGTLLRHPLARRALLKMERSRDWSAAQQPARLLASTSMPVATPAPLSATVE